MDPGQRERWNAIGIYPPTIPCGPKQSKQAIIDDRSCSMRVIRQGSRVTVRMHNVYLFIDINPARRVKIQTLVQAALHSEIGIYTYVVHSGLSLLVSSTSITLEQRSYGMPYDIAILPMSVDLVEALMAAEAEVTV